MENVELKYLDMFQRVLILIVTSTPGKNGILHSRR